MAQLTTRVVSINELAVSSKPSVFPAGFAPAGHRRASGRSAERRDQWGAVREAGLSDDDTLIAAAGDGDERAFATLVSRHIDRAHTLAYRFLGRSEDAEEVAQEAFVRLWRHARKWKPGRARFTTWLHRVVVNLCIDRTRRRTRRNETQLDPDGPWADPAPDAERHTIAGDAIDLARDAVSELPERQRAALLLSVVAGHGNKEIADILGISVGATEQALVRARRTLRAKLKEAI